ncbi:MAG: M23 family metallopeptidase [Crocinitomicaceae bacterium]|nr:M23 family metallopeptidase [Crocinitomicaceae bacterium]
MKFLRKIYAGLRKNLKFSISDPVSFQEVWSINSNRIRVISLTLILIVGVGLLISSLFGTFSGGYFGNEDVSIERDELETQNKKIVALTEQIQAQENYIANIKRILNGEVPIDTPLDSVPPAEGINIDSLNSDPTVSENKLSDKIKEDMLTLSDENSALTYFGSPVTGVISQVFDKKTHPGIDIVTEKDNAIKACLAGTIIYSGYTRKDGYIILIDHGNNFVSVYKHNKRVLKKTGDKVKLGDPIAIVGNTGENTDGPHLHFELWYDQIPVNPEDYIRFTR